MRSFCKGGIYEEFVNSKKFSLPEGEGGAARRAGEAEGQMRLPQEGVGWAAVAAARGVSAPAGGLVQRGCTPHFLFRLAEKKTCRARSKRKGRFWSQLCTYVQSCCTGVGVRWCLRIFGRRPTGAAGCDAGLVVDSRGAVHLKSGCEDALDLLLFPRVPLR